MPLGAKTPKFMDNLQMPENLNEGLVDNAEFSMPRSKSGGQIGARDSGVSTGGGKIVDPGNYERHGKTKGS